MKGNCCTIPCELVLCAVVVKQCGKSVFLQVSSLQPNETDVCGYPGDWKNFSTEPATEGRQSIFFQ